MMREKKFCRNKVRNKNKHKAAHRAPVEMLYIMSQRRVHVSLLEGAKIIQTQHEFFMNYLILTTDKITTIILATKSYYSQGKQ
jgi:hypothetical protein